MTLVKSFVIGKQGLIGRAFYDDLKTTDPKTIGTQHKHLAEPHYFNLNQTDYSSLPIKNRGFTHAIIAAANGTLAKCESHAQETYISNVDGLMRLAQYLSEEGITPVVFSTSYVFDGKKGNYKEGDALSPLNEYGRQNGIIEEKLDHVCRGNYLIVRLNKVLPFDQQVSFLDEMTKNILFEETVFVSSDQLLAPIHIADLLKALYHLQKKGAKGLFNLCGSEVTSRFLLAKEIASLLNKPLSKIREISIHDLPDNISRPQNTTLSIEKAIQWGVSVSPCLNNVIHKVVNKWIKIYSSSETTGLLI